MEISTVRQFSEVVEIIQQHRSKALRTVNEENLLTAWHVGSYVSTKLKSEEWGSKVVTELAEYIRTQHPELKGYGRSNIYNMVMFFEEYSSPMFSNVAATYLNKEIVQPKTGQLAICHSEKLQIEGSNENPSIGIILCPEADNVVVEYAMSRNMSPTMVAEYKRLLIPKEHLQHILKEYCQTMFSGTKS